MIPENMPMRLPLHKRIQTEEPNMNVPRLNLLIKRTTWRPISKNLGDLASRSTNAPQ